jgi:hypothetical protein
MPRKPNQKQIEVNLREARFKSFLKDFLKVWDAELKKDSWLKRRGYFAEYFDNNDPQEIRIYHLSNVTVHGFINPNERWIGDQDLRSELLRLFPQHNNYLRNK